MQQGWHHRLYHGLARGWVRSLYKVMTTLVGWVARSLPDGQMETGREAKLGFPTAGEEKASPPTPPPLLYRTYRTEKCFLAHQKERYTVKERKKEISQGRMIKM